jgi:hypothetical protein
MTPIGSEERARRLKAELTGKDGQQTGPVLT